MSRPLRVNFEGAYYHVMNRGRGKERIFYDEKDHKRFLTILAESCEIFHVEVVAYCLMGNHYHLLIHTPDANLSQFMRQVNGVYTQVYNRRYKKDGTLFKGRYKAIVVQEEFYIIRVVRYIHKNPVKAGLVRKEEDYKYSSHADYLGNRGESWLKYRRCFQKVWGQGRAGIEKYKQYMQQDDDKELEEYYKSKKRAAILGEENYIDMIKEKYIHKQRYYGEIPERRRIENEKVVKELERQLIKKFKINPGDLRSSLRGRDNTARMMGINLSRELTGMKHREIAERFGIGSVRSVGKYCERFKQRLDDDRGLSRIYQKN